MADSVRQRKGKEAPTNVVDKKDGAEPKTASTVDDDERYRPWLDIFRVVTFLLIASCGLSYLISSGESWTWGVERRPDYLRLDYWQRQFVCGLASPSLK